MTAGAAGLALALAAAAPVPHEPGWTARLLASPFDNCFNGIDFDPVAGRLLSADYHAGAVYSIDPASGDFARFADVPGPDELVIDAARGVVYVKQHPEGRLHAFDREGLPLGITGPIPGATGLALDSGWDLVVARPTVLRFSGPVFPGPPVTAAWASNAGLGPEGIDLGPGGELWLADSSAGTLLEVRGGPGPHPEWAAGMPTPLGVAVDPCTGDPLVSHSDGIERVAARGRPTRFATGFSVGLAFDPVGNLFANTGGGVVRFDTPTPLRRTALGNELRAVRAGTEVVLSWTGRPTLGSYAVDRGTAKGAWPAWALVGVWSPRAVLPDVPPPAELYFYRVDGTFCAARP